MTLGELQALEGAVSLARHQLEMQSCRGPRDDMWDQALAHYGNALRAMWDAQRLYADTRARREELV